MNNDAQLYKKPFTAGFAAYAVLFIFSIVFYKERTIFADVAYHLFHIVRTSDFAIQVHRYSAVVTQIFPHIARRLALPLNIIMMVYSAGVMLYYILCYWLCGSVLKNPKLALVLLFSQFLLTTLSYYWIQSELQQGLAFMILLFAIITKAGPQKPRLVPFLIFIAGLVVANFFHPIIIIPIIFTSLFFLVRKDSTFNNLLLIITIVLSSIIYFLKTKYLSNKYDTDAMKGIYNFIYTFPHYFGIASNRLFLANCVNKFYWFPILLLVIGFTYLKQKKWLQLFLFFAFSIGYLLLINVSFPHNNEADFYMETLYLPLGLMLAFPLVYDVIPAIKNRKFVVILVGAILLTGCVRIYMSHYAQLARLNWEREYLNQHIDQKLLVYNHEVPMDTLKIAWGTAYEFWLLSTTEYNKTASIVIDDHVEKLLWYKWENKEFIAPFDRIPYKNLSKPYFIFNDTVSHYDITSSYRR